METYPMQSSLWCNHRAIQLKKVSKNSEKNLELNAGVKDKSRDRYKLKGNSMEQILERTHLANRISSDNRARSDPQLTQKGESHAATGENLPFPVPTLPWLLLAFSRLCFPCLLALPAAAGNGRGREGSRAHYWAGFVAAARCGQDPSTKAHTEEGTIGKPN